MVVMLVLAGCAEERPRPEANVTGRIHPPGIAEETSENFHGRELARRDYDFGLCAKCHGEDFSGGAAGASCLDCHDDSPTACTTCHREDTETGAHATHRTSGATCAECHVVPASWDDDGHIRRGGKADPRPAEVLFGARAALTLDAADRAGPPQYEAGTCRNVYCHGDVLGAAGGAATQPVWTSAATGGCARCHGAPPPSHAQAACATCHPASAPHIDGAIQIGRTAGCDGCHGTAGDPAPPFDLAGNEFITAIGVGAHQAHLTGASQLRAPLACSECHTVPTTVGAVGHIDSPLPADVLPAVGWNRTTQTCGTWCHGSATPVWTQRGGAACGTCHAVPPQTPSHAGVFGVQSCATCHPTAGHMNGGVDVL